MNMQKLQLRTGVLMGGLVGILVGVTTLSLIKLQVIDGDDYARKKSTTMSDLRLEPSRGMILDRNGIPLVMNEQSLSLVLEAPFFPREQDLRNQILAQLIALLEKHKTPWEHPLPLGLSPEGTPYFLENQEREITRLKSKDYLNLNDYATAENCFDALVERYHLEDYPKETALALSSVQFNMQKLDYNKKNPYTFATNITLELKAELEENSAKFAGVRARTVPVRVYADGTLAPHIIGRVAAINAEDYAAHKEEGYRITDEYGVFGIERAAEAYLRGSPGVRRLTEDLNNGTVNEDTITPAQQGNNIVLTLDSKLQKHLEEIFPIEMEKMKAKRHPGVPAAGALIVMDVKNFEILASVSYPGYDISQYRKTAGELSQREDGPLWNRALQGLYEPGSTSKVSVALAALQEHLIDPNHTLYCSGTYTYLGQAFKCPQVRLHQGRAVNVTRALVDSCNSFFYDLGKQLTYERLNFYRQGMGLGQKTGVELPEETGVLDSPERREQASTQWYPGYNLQSAIGQGNLFTPIQLAVYAATVANNGTRYQAHYIQSIRRAGSNEPVKTNQSTELGITGIDKKNYEIIQKAMLELGTGSTAAGRYMKNLPVKVAAKTGTSQVTRKVNGVSQKINNGIFISFAPYERPEIAVIAVGEGCKSSEPVMPIVAEAYRYYFGNLNQTQKIQQEQILL